MKKTLFIDLILLTQFAVAAEYKLDEGHSEIGFSVKHLLVSNVKGRFKKFSGSFEYDKEAKTVKNLNIEIDPASIDTNSEKRDDHLRSDDFFDVKKYPKVTFKAKSVDQIETGKTKTVSGLLKMKDQELPVDLELTFNGEIDHAGFKKVAYSATAEIDRKKWGISWNQDLDKGGVAVSEKVKIIIEGEANLVDTSKIKNNKEKK